MFEREGSPQGAIPSILAMSEVSRRPWSQELLVLPAQELTHQGETCESDLVAVEISPDGIPSVCLGECKERGRIEREDVERLSRVRSAIRRSGVECYVLFAVLRESFSDVELSMLRELSTRFAEERALGLACRARKSGSGP